MLISILYEVLLWIFALLSLPKLLYAMLVKNQYRQSLIRRFGVGFPQVSKGNRRLIWVHAVSVGEVKAVANLVKQLKKQPDNPLILVSSITETGHAEAKRAIPEAEYHVYLPFDFYGVIAPIVKRVKPDQVVLCETDFWYHFLRVAKNNGAHISLVNGKLSDKSMERFKSVSFFTKRLFALFDVFCLQSAFYAERFKAIGIPQEKIVVTGNLKFDSRPTMLTQQQKADLMKQLGIREEDRVIVIGSSHDPEEKLLLGAINHLWKEIPSLKVVIVPRHPERFDLVAKLIGETSIPYARYSDLQSSQQPINASIILIDTMGILGKCYQVADVAIVAGSYTSAVGGHNILEPLWFGVPMIYGPCMHTQPDLVEAVSSFNAGIQAPIESVAEALRILLKDGKKVEELRQASSKLITAMYGSTNRSFEAVDRSRDVANV
ncbi:MAG: 3-deoxy-D-manno-octulosonic acid transferase [Parachlamydiaceae bacterium]